MALPKPLALDLMQTQWASQIDPVLINPIVKGVAITSVVLAANTPKTIPTTLNRTQLGWFLTDLNANAVVWRSSPSFNASNMELTASADVTINLWVF